MKLSIYLDVEPWMNEQGHFYPFTDLGRVKAKTATRYRFDVEIPDPMQPDVVLEPEVKKIDNKAVETTGAK